MNLLTALSIAVSALGWCLLHFVWQAAAIGAAYALVRTALPRGNPRYLAAMFALVAMAACSIVTGVHEFSLVTASFELSVMQVTPVSSAAASLVAIETPTWQSLLGALLPWLVLAWAVGAGLLGARVYRQWRGLRRMLAAAEQLPEWQSRARQFADRLGLRRMVPVLASVRVMTPTLVGWVKPAVVLPLAVLARMPPAQIDLVLAHELAHLKRLDHIANLFQVLLETLFFYHPAVHWISREARNERELCCDALALRVTGGERRDFVAALAGLEDFRAGHAGLALAASGGVLVERAWFIAGCVPQRRPLHLRGHVIAAGAVALAMGLGWAGWREFAWQQRAEALVAANDASVSRQVRQDAVHPLMLLPLPSVLSGLRLRPVASAAISAPDTAEAVATPAIRVAPIAPSAWTFSDIQTHITPIAGPAAESAPVPIAAPRALRTVRPVYPPQALIAGIQRQVIIEFALDASGAPQNLSVVNPGYGPLDAAALQALAEWRFAPPSAAERRYRQAFTFQLGANVGNDAAATSACVVMTGTHICRHVSGTDPGVQVSRPNG
ncbi:MAG TPA: TonB family protein [Rhodanobacteraceae bacterium]|nr:TonB family protein [Rhodanobacteraceae bacterium]